VRSSCETGYRATTESSAIASAVNACVPHTPKPKKSRGSKRSTVYRRPSARRANRLAAPETTRYQHSTDPSSDRSLGSADTGTPKRAPPALAVSIEGSRRARVHTCSPMEVGPDQMEAVIERTGSSSPPSNNTTR
jgi:hypothetical protein